ncbi:hypothetical protein TrLO_g1728 [Triparma laevis f. longispina]|uniref:Uncharacterized protein n=1 Tax=Triparma laevis f. longispina TaxID=1714387 RepID=A0A9W6ZRS9_9STRA|nr:hypothetical protein TrLO_g1728 [Triparma laevis f. longispina]
MENIASSLLTVHTHYFQDSNSSNSSPMTQLTNFLRSSGALHCGTSSITLSDIADICNENNASNSSQMSYDDFYNCFGSVYDLLNPTMKAMSQYQSKRAKSAKKQPAHVAPPAEEHSPQWKAHHFIHDVLLPLTYKHESLSTGKRKSDPLALSAEIISHPLMIQTVTSLEEDMMTLFEHFCTKKQVSITDQRTQIVSEYQALGMNESEYKTFVTFVFPSQTSSSQNSNLLPLFSLTLHTAHHLVPLNYKPQLDDEMYECLNYFMFVEVLILISLSRAPPNVPDSQMVPNISQTLTSILSSVKELQFVSTCHEYSGPFPRHNFPPLTRFLALLKDSEILDSRLSYHEAARIFLDNCEEEDTPANFENCLLRTIPILGALLPGKDKGEAYVISQIQKTFYKFNIPGSGSATPASTSHANHHLNPTQFPASFHHPLTSPRFLQFLASTALASLRYVFLRYGGFISDEVEACAPSIVTSSWQNAVRNQKGALEIPHNELADFAQHFHLVPNLISPHALHTHVQTNAVQNQQVSFSAFLNILADIAITHCIPRHDETTPDDPFGHVQSFKKMLSIIDPKKVMFHSQPNPQTPDEDPSSSLLHDTSTIASIDVEDKNPFDTPFDSAAVDSPRGNPPPPSVNNSTHTSKKELLTEAIALFSANVPYKEQLEIIYLSMCHKKSEENSNSNNNNSSRTQSTAFGHGNTKQSTDHSGITKQDLMTFALQSRITNTSRLTFKKLFDILKKCEHWQRHVDEQSGGGKNKPKNYDQPTKTFLRNTKDGSSHRTRRRNQTIDETFLFGLPSFSLFFYGVALHRCGVNFTSDISDVGERCMMALFESCNPNNHDYCPPQPSDPVFAHDVMHSLNVHDTTIRLSFAIAISSKEKFGDVQGEPLRSPVLEAAEWRLNGEKAADICNLVGLEGSTPFDVTQAMLYALNRSQETNPPDTIADLSLSLCEYEIFIAKLALFQASHSVSKAIRVLLVSLTHLVAIMEGTPSLTDTSLILLLDSSAPPSSLSGGADELIRLYHDPPPFIKSWTFDTLCVMCRACGILDNDFGFGDALEVYEDALSATLPISSTPIKRTNSSTGLTSAWAAVVGREVNLAAFCNFWRGIANGWGSWEKSMSSDSPNSKLSNLLIRRVFPVLALEEGVTLRPAIYDANSVSLLRSHGPALEALFIRYASSQVSEIELRVDKNMNVSGLSTYNPSDHTLGEKHVIPPNLGMSELDFKSFCTDLNLLPQIFPPDIVRNVFSASGSGWVQFVSIGGGGHLIGGTNEKGAAAVGLSFASFCESLLRMASLLNLSDISPTSSEENSAHLDVLLRCLDSEGAIFFKSKTRLAASPVKRSLGTVAGVEDLERLMKLIGDDAGSTKTGAPPGQFAFSIENILELTVRLGLGSSGLLPVLDAFDTARSEREYILMSEAAILVRKLSTGLGLDFERFMKESTEKSLEMKLTDDVQYAGLAVPKGCVSGSVFFKVASDLNNVWTEVSEGKDWAYASTVAQRLIVDCVNNGVCTAQEVHENAAMCVATLSGGGSREEEEGVCIGYSQFDWLVCRIAYCSDTMRAVGEGENRSGGEGGEEEEANTETSEDMLILITEMLKAGSTAVAVVEDSQSQENLAPIVEESSSLGTLSPPTSPLVTIDLDRQFLAIFDVYAHSNVITEVSYLRFLLDVGILEELERVQAIELFRLNESGDSRRETEEEDGEGVCLVMEDFRNCLNCIAMILEKDTEEDMALVTLMRKALDF